MHVYPERNGWMTFLIEPGRCLDFGRIMGNDKTPYTLAYDRWTDDDFLVRFFGDRLGSLNE